MNTHSILQRYDLHAIQQRVKWTVYAILIFNFSFYVLDDMELARHSLREGASFLEWTTTFATTIDELAWFMLLFLFELETYALSDDAFEGRTGILIHAVRLICYAFLAHTIYAYVGEVHALMQAVPLSGINDLCQLAEQGVSFTYNLAYTVVEQSNCSTLSTGTLFFPVDSNSLVTDNGGMAISRTLAWIDLAEASIWLLIVFLIEFMVIMQNRGISSGRFVTAANVVKPVLYVSLLLLSVYWGMQGHWLFVWDELIWIGGFIAIEMNVVEWRGEMQDEVLKPAD